MNEILLVGHGGFYNRGCEAIVRTTSALIRERFPGAEIVLASHTPDEDSNHPAAAGLTVIAHIAPPFSAAWVLCQLAGRVARNHTLASRLRYRDIWPTVAEADVVLSIGGDNYSMYPGFPRTFIGMDRAIHKTRRPLVIWGASIGPFPPGPLENAAMENFRQARLITVRETVTEQYLRENGVVGNVRLVADPAFLLSAEHINTEAFWPEGDGVLGLNVSPLLKAFREDGSDAPILGAAAELIRYALTRGLGVLLIPHVLNKRNSNNDHTFMSALLADRGKGGRRVRIAPDDLDACQTKFVISQCRFLVAARTHATIAGFSTGVPTIPIAYSRKAFGISQDIFGHQDWVVDARGLEDAAPLLSAVQRIVDQEDDVRRTTVERGAVMRERARQGIEHLASVMME